MKFLILALLISGCSFNKKNNEKSSGHHQLYSSPNEDEIKSLATSERRLVIISTNDMKGQLEAQQETATDEHSPEKTLISVGGAEVLARYMDILRKEYPGQVLLLDAGNSLSGTLIARSSGAKALSEMFSRLNYDAIGLASSDLAAGPGLKTSVSPKEWMPHLFKSQKTPVIISNLLDLKTTKPVEWGNTTPQLLKEVNEVKVGIVGLLSDDLPAKLDSSVLNGLYIEPALQSFLKQTRSLRLKGADVIILIMHGGMKCGIERAQTKGLPIAKVNFDPRDPKICENDGALVRFLSGLPAGSVDLVVTGGGPGKTANFVNGIPVIQAFGLGTSFARVDLVWDVVSKKLNAQKVLIHQPVRLCHRFFKKTQDCFTEDSSIDHRQLEPARFLEKDVFPDPVTTTWLKFWREMVVGESRPLLFNESSRLLTQEVAQAVLSASNTDVAVIGGHEWRLSLPQGVTSWRELYSQASARENIRFISMTGEELKKFKDTLPKAWWAFRENEIDLYTREVIKVAVSDSLYSKFKSNDSTHADFIVADSIISWERDAVNVRASGRSPALPHTQP